MAAARSAFANLSGWLAGSVTGSAAAAVAMVAFGSLEGDAGPRGAEAVGYAMLMIVLGVVLTAPAALGLRLALWAFGLTRGLSYAGAGAVAAMLTIVAMQIAAGGTVLPAGVWAAAPFGALAGIVWRQVERALKGPSS